MTAVQHPTPRVVRITVQGADLAGFATDGPAAHVKLVLPPAGHDEVVLPTYADDGSPIFPDGAPRPFLRTYTPLRFDPDALELDVEMVVHGHGPASTWAAQAAVGQRIVVAGPRGGYRVDPDGRAIVLVTDDTGLPAATTVLDALPATTSATVLAEVVDAAEERPLPRADLVEWFHRGDDVAAAGAQLEEAVRRLRLDDGTRLWVACEAAAMRRIRRLLLDRGVPAEHMSTRGYWQLGEADHPDGDHGEDVRP